MFCVNCGSKLSENQKFCTQCGKKVDDTYQNTTANVQESRAATQASSAEVEESSSNTKMKIPKFAKVIAVILALFFVVGLFSPAEEKNIGKENSYSSYTEVVEYDTTPSYSSQTNKNEEVGGVPKTIYLGLCVFYTIAAFVFYHKVFTVYYFSLGNGLLREIICCILVGVFLAGLTLKFSGISALIVVLIGLGMSGKSYSSEGKAGIIAVSVIAAILILITGWAVNF